MAERATSKYNSKGQLLSYSGAKAGKSFESTEEQKMKKWEESYHNKMGAGGLGGASKRTNPEYKKKMEDERKKQHATGWGNT